jgi:hypothetical protein
LPPRPARESNSVPTNTAVAAPGTVCTPAGERKVWVILVCEPKTCCFDAKAEARRVAVEWFVLGYRIEEMELIKAQDTLVDLSGLLARTHDFDHITKRRNDKHLDRFGKHRPVHDYPCLKFTRVHLIHQQRHRPLLFDVIAKMCNCPWDCLGCPFEFPE